jgi:methyltransferase (TIGR00027 family)
MSAAVRALVTRTDPDRLDDPFAEPLVRAVGVDVLTRLARGAVAADGGSGPDGAVEQLWLDIAVVRTRFYDEYFLAAAAAGIRQVVILAAGLDSRAYRLSWPAGTVLYEVDQPSVLEFKTRALAEFGAAPVADRRPVGADLREDWPTSLRANGFDSSRPTAWTAEGLLGYLPADAQDRLLDTVTELSAPGSRLATESRPNPKPGDDGRTRQHLDRIAQRWRTEGFDADLARLRYYGDRNEAARHLADRGWTLRTTTIRELFAANGFDSLGDDEARMADTRYLTGSLR